MAHLPHFIKSAYFEKDYPQHHGSEFAFLGASNSGKSTLINAILKRNLCKTSSKPGHTAIINFFQFEKNTVIVDLPGYGYARRSNKEQNKWRKAIDQYLSMRQNLKLCFVLFDLKRGLMANDVELIEYLSEQELPFMLVATKIDKLNQKEQSQKIKSLKEQVGLFDVLLTSSLKDKGIKQLASHVQITSGLDSQ